MRRRAFPRRRRARRSFHLPLPHVPEGQRKLLCRAGLSARRQTRLDARRAQTLPLFEPRHRAVSAKPAAHLSLSRRRKASRWPSAPSTILPASRRDPVGHRGEAALCRRCRRPARCGDRSPTRRASSFLADLVSYQHPDHDTENGRRRRQDERIGAKFTGGCQCGAVRYRATKRWTMHIFAIAACARKPPAIISCRWLGRRRRGSRSHAASSAGSIRPTSSGAASARLRHAADLRSGRARQRKRRTRFP